MMKVMQHLKMSLRISAFYLRIQKRQELLLLVVNTIRAQIKWKLPLVENIKNESHCDNSKQTNLKQICCIKNETLKINFIYKNFCST